MDKRRGRVVRNEMTGELCRDMLRGRRMAGEVGENGPALPGPGIVVILAVDGLQTGLVGALDVDEFAAVVGARYGLSSRPAGHGLRVIGALVLALCAAHAQRTQ